MLSGDEFKTAEDMRQNQGGNPSRAFAPLRRPNGLGQRAGPKNPRPKNQGPQKIAAPAQNRLWVFHSQGKSHRSHTGPRPRHQNQ